MALNIIKCPRCNSTNKTKLSEGFYHCNQCNNNYYGNIGNNDGLLVKSGRSSLNPLSQSSKKKSLLPVLVIGLLIIYFAIPFIQNMLSHRDDTYVVEPESEDSDNVYPTDILSVQSDKINESAPLVNVAPTGNAYPRAAYVFYQDVDSHKNYLFKANLLTQNSDDNDSNVVTIKNEAGKIVGYDTLSGKVIPNFSQLVHEPLSLDAAVVYADKDSLIIKNKVDGSYQLELLDPYNGKIIWTLSDKELSGIKMLTGKYSSVDNTGIELFRNNFRIKLPPNYYVVDKTGQIIGFGKSN